MFCAQVGIGCASAKEVATAIQKSVRDAKKNLVKINLTKDASFPHFAEHYEHSAKIMLRPAAEGTGEPCNLSLGQSGSHRAPAALDAPGCSASNSHCTYAVLSFHTLGSDPPCSACKAAQPPYKTKKDAGLKPAWLSLCDQLSSPNVHKVMCGCMWNSSS